MKKTIGFIGAGNMAGAIIKGMIKSNQFSGEEIAVYDTDAEKSKLLRDEMGVTICNNNIELIRECDAVLIAVKPNCLEELLKQIAQELDKQNTFVICIAAGQSIEKIESFLTGKNPIVRVMPNINAVASEAMSGYAKNEYVSKEDEEKAVKILKCFGKAIEIDESMFSVFSAVAGCAPAYVYLFADMLARCGVRDGMTKQKSLEIVLDEVIKSSNAFDKCDCDEQFCEIIKNGLNQAFEKDKKI